jgi:hypothetical protein
MPSVERTVAGRPASRPTRMGRRIVRRDTQRLCRDMSLAGARAAAYGAKHRIMGRRRNSVLSRPGWTDSGLQTVMDGDDVASPPNASS